MNGQQKVPPPPSCVFQFYSAFRPFPLMNMGLISGLVKEEAVNEVAAGFRGCLMRNLLCLRRKSPLIVTMR